MYQNIRNTFITTHIMYASQIIQQRRSAICKRQTRNRPLLKHEILDLLYLSNTIELRVSAQHHFSLIASDFINFFSLLLYSAVQYNVIRFARNFRYIQLIQNNIFSIHSILDCFIINNIQFHPGYPQNMQLDQHRDVLLCINPNSAQRLSI
jgi:hypothetical protein